MEGRIVALLSVFALIVAIAACVIYSVRVDDAKLAHANAQQRLESIEKTISNREVVHDARAEMALETAAQKAKLVSTSEKIAELEKAINAAIANAAQQEVDAQMLRMELVENIEAVRTESAGKSIGEIKLADGRVLADVKIQKVDDEMVSVQHSLGVSRLNAKQLPAALNDKFRLGIVASLAQPEEPKAPDASQPAASVSSPIAVTPPPPEITPAAKDNAAYRETKEKSLQERIAQLNAQITVASGSAALWRRNAADARSLHYNAQANGKISSHLAKAGYATRTADNIDKQIISTRATIQLLQDELSKLQAR